MKSVIELDIDAEQTKVAALFDHLPTFPRWMKELARVELISGDGSAPGSSARLVPKEDGIVFVATVVAREPPRSSQLVLDAANVSVRVTGTFVKRSGHSTTLVSEEVFVFKGLLAGFWGFLGRRSIRTAHRRHMESFKQFVEGHA